MLAAALLALCGRFPSLRCVCVAGWPRPSVSSYGGGDYIPARLALPVASICAPFWRPFGVAVVSNAGAVSLRPFRWCRCAYKVATPRAALLCRYPQRGRYLRQQSQRETIPATRARRVFTSLAALLLVFSGYRAAAGLCGLLLRGGRIIIRQNPARPCGGGVLRPRRAYLVNLSKNYPANVWRLVAVRGIAPRQWSKHGQRQNGRRYALKSALNSARVAKRWPSLPADNTDTATASGAPLSAFVALRYWRPSFAVTFSILTPYTATAAPSL